MATQLETRPVDEHHAMAAGGREEKQLVTVAYVVHTFQMGGLERCVARLVNHLDPQQFRPLVICLNRSGDAAKWIHRPDVPIVALGKAAGNDPRVVWRLAGELRRRGVDIVHSHNWGTLVETALARRWSRIPIHFHAEHGLELADMQIGSWRRRLRGRVTRWALQSADAVMAVSEQVRSKLAARSGISCEEVMLIPNGVELPSGPGGAKSSDGIRQSLGIGRDAWLLGSVGRLAPVKAFEVAIEAVARLVAGGQDVHLILVGEGPEQARLTAAAVEAEIAPRVHLVGQQEDVASWLSAMDLYVNSSISEGMSLSILEAMAAGLPSVVTDVGANALLVGGDHPCGLVVPPANAAGLASAITSLMEDPQRRQGFARQARQRQGEQFGTKRMVQRYAEVYLDLLAGGERRRPTA